MNSKLPKIIFIYPYLSSFIKTDLELLKRHFNVDAIHWTRTLDIINVLHIMWLVFRTDLSFTWFAGGHAARMVFISKLFRKKSIVVVGGYEVANEPEIHYGLMISQESSRRVKYVLENADVVLTVDDSLKKDAINNVGESGNNILTVPTGYDPEKWKPNGEKENLVITVAAIEIPDKIRLKGIDTFVLSARLLPNVKFKVIGVQNEALEKIKSISPQNVEFIGFLTHEELISHYQKAKVYCQLSWREGLPNSLCEAMLCECVPVGTDRYGIVTAIGDTGLYVPYGDPKATADAIMKGLQSDKGKDARERIKTMLPMEKREKELVNIIYRILEPGQEKR
jgi:glycosyltransferase involved in cell wall biosynthesis